MTDLVPLALTHRVRDTCLCLHLQRAARVVARRFDEALRPMGLTSGQFSLLMSLNGPKAPTMGSVADLLAMDRTTLTANLKPLERRGLVGISVDGADRRSRRLALSRSGRALLAKAVPAWKQTQAAVEGLLARSSPHGFRAELLGLSRGPGLIPGSPPITGNTAPSRGRERAGNHESEQHQGGVSLVRADDQRHEGR